MFLECNENAACAAHDIADAAAGAHHAGQALHRQLAALEWRVHVGSALAGMAKKPGSASTRSSQACTAW